jgi:fumarylacetoacetase
MEMIPINEAEDYIFGMVLLNDWSARDIQKWECAAWTLLGKSFASSISPWIVTMDALEPLESLAPRSSPLPLFATKGKHSFDIHLEAIQPENAEPTVISKSNFKYMYWTMNQQLTHHTSNGCRVNLEI